MTAPILLVVPSRGRPDRAAEAIESWRQTSSGESNFLLVLDDDDPTLDAYARPDDIEVAVGPRIRMIPALNREVVARPGYDIYGFMGDDHRLRTPGWDMIVAANTGPYGVLYGDDLLQRENLATAVFLGGDLVRALGWFAPPCLTHLYADNAWMAIGRTLGTLQYRPDIVIEHLHPIAGKAAWDERYVEVNSDEMYSTDREAFQEWIRSGAAVSDLERVHAAMVAA